MRPGEEFYSGDMGIFHPALTEFASGDFRKHVEGTFCRECALRRMFALAQECGRVEKAFAKGPYASRRTPSRARHHSRRTSAHISPLRLRCFVTLRRSDALGRCGPRERSVQVQHGKTEGTPQDSTATTLASDFGHAQGCHIGPSSIKKQQARHSSEWRETVRVVHAPVTHALLGGHRTWSRSLSDTPPGPRT